ncbi:hypothetical protein BJY01DRAFT_218857 [Aspergillus pseudoustus]|uniref:Uncharacterized protein n=1 Tax=Aspergillus pseudoustus TaxID=1810923 RepID=A0ABR4JIV3_9EURO
MLGFKGGEGDESKKKKKDIVIRGVIGGWSGSTGCLCVSIWRVGPGLLEPRTQTEGSDDNNPPSKANAWNPHRIYSSPSILDLVEIYAL